MVAFPQYSLYCRGDRQFIALIHKVICRTSVKFSMTGAYSLMSNCWLQMKFGRLQIRRFFTRLAVSNLRPKICVNILKLIMDGNEHNLVRYNRTLSLLIPMNFNFEVELVMSRQRNDFLLRDITSSTLRNTSLTNSIPVIIRAWCKQIIRNLPHTRISTRPRHYYNNI